MIPFLLKLTRTEWDAEKQDRACKAILALVHNIYHPTSCAKTMKPQELTKFTNLLKGWDVRCNAWPCVSQSNAARALLPFITVHDRGVHGA